MSYAIDSMDKICGDYLIRFVVDRCGVEKFIVKDIFSKLISLKDKDFADLSQLSNFTDFQYFNVIKNYNVDTQMNMNVDKFRMTIEDLKMKLFEGTLPYL